MRHYDYAQPNYYFVTICTHEKNCIFGSPGHLNIYGEIASTGITLIPNHFPSVKVDKFMVMPNHVHAIIILEHSDTDLTMLIGQYKSYVSRCIHRINPSVKVWQTSFHDHVIRNQESYEKIWLYIEANPQNWTKDCFYINLE